MDDYENDGRDFNENIDEGPLHVENEYNIFTKTPNVAETKPEEPEKKSTDVRKGRSCNCKEIKKRKMKRNKTDSTSDGNDTNGTTRTIDKKNAEVSKKKGRRGRKKKEPRLVNPFIIFYLEMYYKNPTKCVADIATEAGRIWSRMSAKEKEDYINKARLASAKSKAAKLEMKRLQKEQKLKKMRKKC